MQYLMSTVQNIDVILLYSLGSRKRRTVPTTILLPLIYKVFSQKSPREYIEREIDIYIDIDITVHWSYFQ